jgi:hypothetical protein
MSSTPVTVIGPDQKKYAFPAGTTKEKAIAFFRQKGISGPKDSPTAAPKPKGDDPSGYLFKTGTPHQIEKGIGQGAEAIFGLKPGENPHDPSGLTAKDVATQTVGNMYHAYQQSAKSPYTQGIPPLVLADVLGAGIESVFQTAGHGAKETYKGLSKRDARIASMGITEMLGSVAQIASLGEGGEDLAKKLASPKGAITEASKSSTAQGPNLATSKWLFSKAKIADLENKYVHARGLQLKSMYAKTVSNINDEIARHAKAVANAVPKDAIDAKQELADANQAISDIVKTPEKYPPVLGQIVQSIKAHPSGLWDFETAKQFRTNVASAMERASGPMKAALSEVYKNMTDKMAKAADDAGAKFSWNHYNELSKKFHQQFAEHVDSITKSKTGQAVSRILLKDKGISKEVINEMSKYGLSKDLTTKFISEAERINSYRQSLGKNLRRYIGNATGLSTYFGARMLGVPWVSSFGPAFVAGYLEDYAKRIINASKLDRSVVETQYGKRSLPRPVKTQETGTPPTGPSASPSAGGTPTPPVEPPKIRPLTDVEKAALRRDYSARNAVATASSTVEDKTQALRTDNLKLEKELRNHTGSAEERSLAEQRLAQNRAMIEDLESKTTMTGPGAHASTTADPISGSSSTPLTSSLDEPKVTKVPEGEHGKGPLGKRASDAERKAAERAKAVSEMPSSGIVEGTGGVLGRHESIEEVPTIEIEDDLKAMGPEGKLLYSALQKTRRFEKWDDDVYRGELLDTFISYLNRGAKKAASGSK